MILFACISFMLLVTRNFSDTHDAILLHATSCILQVASYMGGLRVRNVNFIKRNSIT